MIAQTEQNETTTTKPARPFGVTLAIFAGIVLFGLTPLLVSVSMLYLNNMIYQDDDTALSGIRLDGLPQDPLIALGIAGVVFLIIALWCWRGRPTITRFIYQGIVLVYAGIVIVFDFVQTEPDALTSGDATTATLTVLYRAAIILFVIYTLWFMNRWSARAFYRGYYTQHDLDLLKAARQPVPENGQTGTEHSRAVS